jgi:hypothetical protein
MRAERGRIPRALLAALLATGVLPATPCGAQSLRGVAEVIYANTDRARDPYDIESWQTTLQLDHSTPLRGALILSTQFRWNQLDIARGPESARYPRLVVRLSHPVYGGSAGYRPVTVTDAQGYTSKQQELRFTGYLLKPGLPSLTATWSRVHVDPQQGLPGGAAIRRDLTGNYTFRKFDFRGTYGDHSRESSGGTTRSTVDDRYSLGTTGHFKGSRWDGTASYDYLQSRKKSGGDVASIGRVHSLSANGSLRLDRKTIGTLNYSFVHTQTVQPATAAVVDNNGSLIVARDLSRVWRATAGGGVRTASIGEFHETESYVIGTLSASARVRRDWTLSASASQSYNWLPDENGRPITGVTASTLMRLARRLEVFGGAEGSYATNPLAPTDSATMEQQYTTRLGAGLRATPRPPITLTASASRSRSSATFGWGGEVSTAYVARADWRPVEGGHVNAQWSRSSGFRLGEKSRDSFQSTAEWTPSYYFQASLTYSWFTQPTVDTATSLTGNRQAFGGRVVVGLTRDLRATFQYSEADSRLPTQTQLWSITVTDNFGR